jgi:hypothetical protein
VAGLSAALLLIAGVWLLGQIRDDRHAALSERRTASHNELKSCDPPSFRPSYLPWVKAGDPIPPPEERRDGRNVVLTWLGDSGSDRRRPYVSLVAEYRSSLAASVDHSPTSAIDVRGTTGYVSWVGDPGVGELAVVWSENDQPCGTFSLHLLDSEFSEARAESEIKQVAVSL